MIEDDENHEWEYRIVWRESGLWRVGVIVSGGSLNCTHWMDGSIVTEAIIQRRRKRDHLDPTPCEGIEHPIWRDWEASPDAEIQAVLVRKGMPFRSLEK
jgi:hypothetical protein